VDDDGDGLNVYSVVQLGSEGTSGMITDDSLYIQAGYINWNAVHVTKYTSDSLGDP